MALNPINLFARRQGAGQGQNNNQIGRLQRLGYALGSQGLQGYVSGALGATNPYAMPSPIGSALQNLVAGAMGGKFLREARNLQTERKAAQTAMANILMGGAVPEVTAAPPEVPTGTLGQIGQFFRPQRLTQEQALAPYSGATAITPEMITASGADPLQVAMTKKQFSALQRQENYRKAHKTFLERQRFLNNNEPIPDDVRIEWENVQKLDFPIEMPAVDFKVIDIGEKGKGVVGVNIFGQAVGVPKVVPSINQWAGMSPIVQAMRREQGKILAKYNPPEVEKNLNTLSEALKRLADTTKPELTGGIFATAANFAGENMPWLLSVWPDILGGKVAQESVDMAERVADITQRSMKQILGAAFTEKEGAGIIRRAYNPNLPQALNERRLRALYKSLKRQHDIKVSQIKYLNKHGSLEGYQFPSDAMSQETDTANVSAFNSTIDSVRLSSKDLMEAVGTVKTIEDINSLLAPYVKKDEEGVAFLTKRGEEAYNDKGKKNAIIELIRKRDSLTASPKQ
jgi:hypothetical protein